MYCVKRNIFIGILVKYKEASLGFISFMDFVNYGGCSAGKDIGVQEYVFVELLFEGRLLNFIFQKFSMLFDTINKKVVSIYRASLNAIFINALLDLFNCI